ncbi:very-short-patch-repair endonuclease [Bradyrhizobium japonicum]
MTYGPEPGSAVLKQRFRPINRKQGHRRLNVLFSRARTRIGLFTSFSSSDVKPTSDSAEGVHVLQKYLEYAETRGRMATNPEGEGEPDSDFEVEVADRLRARGFTVDYQVGSSGYKIDLGVRHPDFAERYLAGIECDGVAYHSSKSARDRDRLREEVLKDKGWQIARVWSTDWFDDPALQTDRLVAKLEALRARPAVAEDDYVIAGAPEPEAAEEPPALSRHPSVESRPSNPDIVSLVELDQDPPSEDGPLSEAECFESLRRLRDGVIAVEVVNWEAHRSLLRDAMIETFVRQRITDPDQWFEKIPGYLRQGTNPIEKGRYLERVCDIVGRLKDEVAFTPRHPASRTSRSARL